MTTSNTRFPLSLDQIRPLCRDLSTPMDVARWLIDMADADLFLHWDDDICEDLCDGDGAHLFEPDAARAMQDTIDAMWAVAKDSGFCPHDWTLPLYDLAWSHEQEPLASDLIVDGFNATQSAKNEWTLEHVAEFSLNEAQRAALLIAVTAKERSEAFESQPTETVSVYWTASVAYEIHDLEVPVGATREEIMALIEEDGSGYAAGGEQVHTHALIVEKA